MKKGIRSRELMLSGGKWTWNRNLMGDGDSGEGIRKLISAREMGKE